MKENIRKEKGITLIALIITIIILLILAVVSVNVVIHNGIIDKTKESVSKYKEEEQREMEKLNKLDEQMGQYSGNVSWWEVREDEESKLNYTHYQTGYEIATNYDSRKGVAILPLSADANKDIIAIQDNEKFGDSAFYFILTDEAKEWMQQQVNIKIEKYKWYLSSEDGIREYTGESPISMEDFTDEQIYCKSYLQRVINSFK